MTLNNFDVFFFGGGGGLHTICLGLVLSKLEGRFNVELQSAWFHSAVPTRPEKAQKMRSNLEND